MNNKKKSWLLILSILVLVILLTPVAGSIYEMIIGHKLSGGFLGGMPAKYYEGFFISLFFIVPLIFVLFGPNKKYKTILISLLVFVIVLLILGAWEQLIISIIAALLGWLIGEGVLRLYQATKKK